MWNLLKVRALKGKGEGLVLYNPEADPDGSEKFFQAKGLLSVKSDLSISKKCSLFKACRISAKTEVPLKKTTKLSNFR